MRGGGDIDDFYYGDNDEHVAKTELPGFVTDPIGVLRRRWPWMLFFLVSGLLLTTGATMLIKPEYTANATVLVTSQRISEEFVRSTIDSDETEKINAIIGEVRSRQSVWRLVEEFDLFASDDPEAVIPMQERVAKVQQGMSIEPQSGASSNRRGQGAVVYQLSFRYADPKIAADVANSLAQQFTDTHLELRHRQARLTTKFLQAELKEVEEELGRQERKIREFKERYRGELPGELSTNLSRLDRLQQQRESLSLQIAEAETRLATITQNEQLDPNSSRGRLETLRSQYEAGLGRYTPEHPNLISIKRQIEALERMVESSVSQQTGASGSTASMLEELRRQRDQTVIELQLLDARVGNTPERQEELDALVQRADVLREAYQEFLRKVGQAELSEAVESAQQGERAMILDSAHPPNRPDRSPVMMIALGLIASLGMAFGSAFLLEIFDAVIVTPGELERDAHVPVFASIPHVN